MLGIMRRIIAANSISKTLANGIGIDSTLNGMQRDIAANGIGTTLLGSVPDFW
jgi:hypothetical protein